MVDDDSGVREITAAMLRELGYDVHEAGSGGAALELLAREPNIDLMLVDYAMPGMSGTDVARHVRATKPLLPTLFITGFADLTALVGVSESHIIGKPFHQHELAVKVRVALAEATAGHDRSESQLRAPCVAPRPQRRFPRSASRPGPGRTRELARCLT